MITNRGQNKPILFVLDNLKIIGQWETDVMT